MELELWLMRHGEAADPDAFGSDHERALTERGRRQVRELGLWLAARIAPPEVIWHSPLRRARETAKVMAEEFATEALEQPVLAPGMRAESLLAELAARSVSRALCVGHQPDIGRALSELIGGGRMSIAPGTCAAVAFRGPIIACAGSLRWFADAAWFTT